MPGIVKMFSSHTNAHITNPQVANIRSLCNIYNTNNNNNNNYMRYLEQVNMQNNILTQNKGSYQYSSIHRYLNIMPTSLMPNHTVSKIVQLQIRQYIKSSYKDSQNVFTFLKPLIKKHGDTVPDSLNSSSGKKGRSFMMNNEKFIFHKTREIEKEVDDIKKMTIETKRTLAEKSKSIPLKNAAKQNIDINRIADQVYQNIERRIWIERERRGI